MSTTRTPRAVSSAHGPAAGEAEEAAPGTRMLDHCTVCGLSREDLLSGPEFTTALVVHLDHRVPTCGDCGAALSFWLHRPDCPQLPLPEVVPVGHRRWMVASGSYCPGGYWPVALTNVGGASVMTCACPAGRRQAERPIAEQVGCRHLRAVVRHQDQMNRRPPMPVDAGSFVD